MAWSDSLLSFANAFSCVSIISFIWVYDTQPRGLTFCLFSRGLRSGVGLQLDQRILALLKPLPRDLCLSNVR
jgi:hypothetical protein